MITNVRVEYHGVVLGFRLVWDVSEHDRWHAWFRVEAALEAPPPTAPYDGVLYRTIPSPCGDIRNGQIRLDDLKPGGTRRKQLSFALREAEAADLFGKAIGAYHSEIAAEEARKLAARRSAAEARNASTLRALLARAVVYVELGTDPDWTGEARAVLAVIEAEAGA